MREKTNQELTNDTLWKVWHGEVPAFYSDPEDMTVCGVCAGKYDGDDITTQPIEHHHGFTCSDCGRVIDEQ